MDAIYEVHGLTKRYGRTAALNGVDFAVTPGKLVGLLGPNGSGKTTLMKISAGLLQPTAGSVIIDKVPVGVFTKAVTSYLPDRMALPTEFTAADAVSLYNDFFPDFDKAKADTLRDCLLAAGRYGLAGLPLRYKLKLAWCMVRYKMSFADGVALYGKYVGNWGGAATRWRFDAKNGDTVVKSVTLCPSHRLHLEVTPSATVLQEGDTYDMAGVRVRILDENGSPAIYAQLPLTFAVTGAAALVGDWLPCGLPALPTDSPFGAIRVPELPLPNPFTFDPGADCPEGELPEEVGPTICTSEPPEEEFPELPPEDMPGPVAGPLELLPEETPLPIELE